MFFVNLDNDHLSCQKSNIIKRTQELWARSANSDVVGRIMSIILFRITEHLLASQVEVLYLVVLAVMRAAFKKGCDRRG